MKVVKREVRLVALTQPQQLYRLSHHRVQEGEGEPRDGIVLSADNVSFKVLHTFCPQL